MVLYKQISISIVLCCVQWRGLAKSDKEYYEAKARRIQEQIQLKQAAAERAFNETMAANYPTLGGTQSPDSRASPTAGTPHATPGQSPLQPPHPQGTPSHPTPTPHPVSHPSYYPTLRGTQSPDPHPTPGQSPLLLPHPQGALSHLPPTPHPVSHPSYCPTLRGHSVT